MIATLTTSPPEDGGSFVLEDVSWELYETLRDELDRHGHRIYITYDNGSLELRSPSPKHERWKTLVGSLIEIIGTELNIPMCCLGSTTFKRKDLKKGLEPDECYYIQHEARMRNKDDIDLGSDPPPDLVVETDITHRAVNREKIYAAMGVPEIWRLRQTGLEFLHLQPSGQYESHDRSLAFPFLSRTDIERFLEMIPATNETAIRRAFRDWVRHLH